MLKGIMCVLYTCIYVRYGFCVNEKYCATKITKSHLAESIWSLNKIIKLFMSKSLYMAKFFFCFHVGIKFTLSYLSKCIPCVTHWLYFTNACILHYSIWNFKSVAHVHTNKIHKNWYSTNIISYSVFKLIALIWNLLTQFISY